MKKTFFIALISLGLSLTACGFEPMYGAHAPSASSAAINAAPEAALDRIDIAIIPDAEGVYLRNLLIDRFYQSGYPANPAYTLVVEKVGQGRTDLDITIESEATRRLLTLTTSMKLLDNVSKAIVLDRSFKVVNSYDVIGSQFSTRIAEQDAMEAALADIARQIELQITLFLNRGGAPSPVGAPVPETSPTGAPGYHPIRR